MFLLCSFWPLQLAQSLMRREGFPKASESDAMYDNDRHINGGFMRVKVQEIGTALHPSERVVEVKTATGKERLIVDRRSIENGSVSVGSPISRKGDLWLVELPRETMAGLWRIWVKANSLVSESSKVRAA